MRLFAEELFHHRLDGGDSRRSADEDHFIDFTGAQTSVAEGVLNGLFGPLDQISDQLLELCSTQGHLQMLRPRCIGGDERKVDIGTR